MPKTPETPEWMDYLFEREIITPKQYAGFWQLYWGGLDVQMILDSYFKVLDDQTEIRRILDMLTEFKEKSEI